MLAKESGVISARRSCGRPADETVLTTDFLTSAISLHRVARLLLRGGERAGKPDQQLACRGGGRNTPKPPCVDLTR